MIYNAASSRAHLWKITREFLAFFPLAVALLTATGVAHYYVSMRAERMERETAAMLNLERAKAAIAGDLASVASDLLFLANHNEQQGLFEDSGDAARNVLARQFLVFVREKQIYDQIRCLDKTGNEMIRVDFHGGEPMIVPQTQLRNKVKRYYFSKTWALERGEIYLSPLDLQMEHGRIAQPPKPVLRFGTPVFDRAGHKKGVLLLSYFGERLIGSFEKAAADIADRIMLLNAEGFWLRSPRHEDEWGFMFGSDRTFGKSYSGAWHRIRASDSGQFENADGTFSFTTIYPLRYVGANRESTAPDRGGEYHWKLVSHWSPSSLTAGLSSFLRRHLLLYVAMLGLLAVATLLFACTSVRHKQAAARLEFERRFREVLEGIDLLALSLDPRGKVDFCNKTVPELLGRKWEEVIGQDWFETFVPAAAREQDRSWFRRLIDRDVTPARYESEIETRSGERRLIAWNDTLLFDSQRRVIGVTRIGDDVTEARQSEERLRKLSWAVEQSPSTVIITDTKGKIEYVNPKFTKLTGYTLDEVRGRTPRILKSGNTDTATYRQLWETITAGREWHGMLHNKKKSGELYWEATCISPIRNAKGEITHFIAVKEDITERMQLEERLRRVVESTPSGILMVNQEGKIVLVNCQTERLFGYRRDELIGQPVETLMPKRFRNRHLGQRDGFFLKGEARAMGVGCDLFGLRKDGTEFPVEIGLSPIETQEGKLALSAIVDITYRKRLERELEDRNREIARTQALAAMGRMASMVAHDLRNPLSCIRMSLQMLGARSFQDWGDAEHELKQIALEQVRYMDELMADLLTYSRPDALKPEWLCLDKLLETAVILAQKYIDDHKVRVKTSYQPGLPTVHGDADKLRRAFSNIIVNAAQATENIEGRRPQVNISARLELGKDCPWVRVEIRDNGRGIEPGQEDAVFEPFFTRRAKGTGLGLAIVKRIIDQHRGSVCLQPAGRRGTCAVVILPTGPIDSGTIGATDSDAVDVARGPAGRGAVLVGKG